MSSGSACGNSNSRRLDAEPWRQNPGDIFPGFQTAEGDLSAAGTGLHGNRRAAAVAQQHYLGTRNDGSLGINNFYLKGISGKIAGENRGR